MSVRERMTYLGGRMEIQSSPGQGTAISLELRVTALRELQAGEVS